jgi:hypothetical protein
MSGIGAGMVLFGLLMVLLVLRVPIGIAMFSVGADAAHGCSIAGSVAP